MTKLIRKEDRKRSNPHENELDIAVEKKTGRMWALRNN